MQTCRLRESNMTRRSFRIAAVACACVSAALLGPSAASQQPGTVLKVKPAVVHPAATLPAGAAQAAEASPTISAATHYLPANAAERAAISSRLAQGDCVQPLQALSMTRMLDNRPLERPKPVIILKGDRDTTLGRVRTVMSSNGFTEVSSDADSGELLVSRVDTGYQGARDDLLIWAEGQAGDANRIRVYLQYGRFEPFFGSTTAQRVATSTDEVQKRIGAVRQALVNLGAT